jgi:omega-hydroxy-beta-dihydromenaquinone-9 sulfotransferase
MSNFIKALFLLPPKRESKEFRKSFTKSMVKSVILILFLFQWILNQLCFLLDEIFFFYYRFIKINKPIMVIGTPRTGTTILFRTLALDNENFTNFTFAEILFAPSITQKLILYTVYRLDRLFLSPLKKSLLFMANLRENPYSRIHSFELFQPEEDEFLLLNIFSTVILRYFFPRSLVFDKYIHFDESLSEHEKKSIMQFKIRCIKKHLFFWQIISGKKRTFLSKNPIFSPKIDTLYATFPDLRVIYTKRDIKEVVPSFVSMSGAILQQIHRTKVKYPNAEDAKNAMIEWDIQLSKKMALKDSESYFVCHYHEFKSDMKGTIINIYKFFGLRLNENFAWILEKKSKENDTYKSRHLYMNPEMKKAIGEI